MLSLWPELRRHVATRRVALLVWWRGARGEVVILFLFVWLVAAVALSSVFHRNDWESSPLWPVALGALLAGAAVLAQAGHHLRVFSDPLGGRSVSTDGIMVRPSTPADGLAVLDTIDDVVMAANGWDMKERERVEEQVRAGRRVGEYVIADHDSTVVGTISLNYVSAGPHQPTIGIWLGPQGRGRGLATKALLGILVLAAEIGLERCYLGTDADNIAMRRAALAAGGDAISTHPHLLPNGTTVSSVWFEFVSPKP